MEQSVAIEAPTSHVLEIPQGEVVRGISGRTVITAEINPGACVLGITTEGKDPDRFAAGHLQPGEIVRELTALAETGQGVVAVHQGVVEGIIKDLYTSGQKLTPEEIRSRFRSRDLHDLTALT